jgi:hypothetical protein
MQYYTLTQKETDSRADFAPLFPAKTAMYVTSDIPSQAWSVAELRFRAETMFNY